jgi:hypothetical protein
MTGQPLLATAATSAPFPTVTCIDYRQP